MPDQKNLILAILISFVILIGFQVGYQYFFPPPVDDAYQRQAELEITGETAVEGATPGDPRALPGQTEVGAAAPAPSRADALAAAPGRVPINTPNLHGSINLQGGRIDDLTLVRYHETTAPGSPDIVLLSPPGSPSPYSPYYADFGWTAAAADMPVPGPDTVWTADAEALTPAAPVTLTWDNGAGLVFERTIAVDPDFMFTVEDRVTNTGQAPVALTPYGRILRFGEPTVEGFFILHEGPYGVFDGTLQEYDYDDIEDEEGGTIALDSTGGWLGFTDKYWMVALIPPQTVPFTGQFIHRLEGEQDRYLATLATAPATLAPGATAAVTNHLFAGAKEVTLVDRYEAALGIDKFDRAIDWGWFYFLTKPIFYLLKYIHDLVGNFGVAILVLTVLVKLVFFPLANKSYKSMGQMKALQPEMMKLRERFADDRQKLNAELMDLYRKNKVNPASGCLPIIVQIPVFFALYKVLFVTIEMRHAPFFGWIQDLSAPDPTSLFNLFGVIPWDPPQMLMIGVWPLIMGVTMYLQQKLNPAPPDPVQAKIFMLLPVVFTVMLASFPAGLVIYWAWNNALTILQQWLIMRRHGVRPGGGADKPAAKAPAEESPAAAAAPEAAVAAPSPAERPTPPDRRPRAAGGGKRRRS